MPVNIAGLTTNAVGSSLSSWKQEVKELLAKAERADSQGEIDPGRLPQEIAKRQALQANLEAARQRLEESYRQEFAAQGRV
jgi:hypothetical protein